MLIPIETQTLFSETLERARLADLDRTFGHLVGNFGQKTVSGGVFWYFRTSEGRQGRKEFFVGPDTDAIRTLIAQYQIQKEEGTSTRKQLQRMATMLTHGGCMATDHVSARVVEALATGGIFRMGGVLVGTHAYVALGNLMGVRWKSAIRTQDLDVAAFRTMAVAVPQQETADIGGTLEALNMGFLPTPGLNPRSPHTSYHIRGKELKVDLLTTASRRGPFAPVFIPRFKAAALPMPYMDFLLEDNTEALILAGDAATLVKVPDPARYGLHKLLVASERPIIEQTKVIKDIAQVSEVLGFLLEMRPIDVEIAFARLTEKGLHKRALGSAQRHLPKDSSVLQFLLEQPA
ncbi:MAG: nucleotidyltransferase domain-containing protein [Holophaga sp.]|nr:nucleotidyltransferase domain-containing protein [Holophaga sp.]